MFYFYLAGTQTLCHCNICFVLGPNLIHTLNHRHCVLGSESSRLLKSATCLSSNSPTNVKCLLTFGRTRGPFLYCQVFVWVKSLFRSKKYGSFEESVHGVQSIFTPRGALIVKLGEVSLLQFCSFRNMWTQRSLITWTIQYFTHMPSICVWMKEWPKMHQSTNVADCTASCLILWEENLVLW